VRVGWRLAVLLGLLAAAGGLIVLTPEVREGQSGSRIHSLPAEIAGWTATEGAPESALPIDPNEKASIRRAYRRDERVIWVSIALFTRQDDPDQRASINRIYPERNTSRIEQMTLPITLNGMPDSVITVPAVVVHTGEERLVVVYWHQLGQRAYGSDYRYRLALMREVLFARRGDAVLVRLAIPVEPSEAPRDMLRATSELAPALHAALIQALRLPGLARS